MVWPATTVDTTNFDDVTDPPSMARLQLLETVNDIKAILAMRGVADGIADLDTSARIPISRLYTNVANGLIQLDGNGDVPVSLFNTNSPSNPAVLGGDARIGYERDRFVALGDPSVSLVQSSWNGINANKDVWQTVSNATLQSAVARRALLYLKVGISGSLNTSHHGRAYTYIRKTGSGLGAGYSTRRAVSSTDYYSTQQMTDRMIAVNLDANSRYDYLTSWDAIFNSAGITITTVIYLVGYWL